MKNEYKVIIPFFTLFLIIGLSIFDDYGISYDENIQRIVGIDNYNYIFNGDQSFLENQSRYYGSLIDILLAIIEKGLGMTDLASIFDMRHAVTFLIFYTSVIFFYLLIKEQYGWKYGLAGSLFLVLTPRILTHSFYNQKDLGFLSLFIIATYTLYKLLKKQDKMTITAHSLMTGALIAMRIPGLIMPPITITLLLINSYLNKKEYKVNVIIGYILLSTLFTIILWPGLWADPVKNFIEAVTFLSKSGFYTTTTYYQGVYYDCNDLPWHYIPVWIWISTPILYTSLFLIGMIISIILFIKNPKKFYKDNNELIAYNAILWSVIFIFIYRKLSLFNGWRHLYFLYPFILLIAIYGLKKIYEYSKKKFTRFNNHKIKASLIIKIVIAACLINTLYTMISMHPYEYVYFNEIMSQDMQHMKENYELDYWGLSINEALKWIVDHADTDDILIYSFNKGASYSLTQEERSKIKYVSTPISGEYMIVNYDHFQTDYPRGKEVYAIWVGNTKIMAINKQVPVSEEMFYYLLAKMNEKTPISELQFYEIIFSLQKEDAPMTEEEFFEWLVKE